MEGLKRVLRSLRAGEIQTVARDLPEPSPLAHALLNSQPYTFLDEAPLEERRARAVQVRRSLPAEDAAGLGALDASAIEQVVADARPLIRDAEELHDWLLAAVLVPIEGVPSHLLDALVATGRAARLTVSVTDRLEPTPTRNEVFDTSQRTFAVCAERILHIHALFPEREVEPLLAPLPEDAPVDREVAVLAAVRGRMEVAGPVAVTGLSLALALPPEDVTLALHQLESEGQVLRGNFRPGGTELEWCDRRLLQRIHRLTVGRLRREIEPLSAQDFMRFLFRWHHLERVGRARRSGRAAPGGVAARGLGGARRGVGAGALARTGPRQRPRVAGAGLLGRRRGVGPPDAPRAPSGGSSPRRRGGPDPTAGPDPEAQAHRDA